MIAYCGLDCTKCGAFMATAANDDALRAKTADEWSKTFKVQIPPDSINCTGCTSDGIKFHYCDQICEIRKCGLAHKVDTCAVCPDYVCEKLKGFFQMAPEAQQNLERLRKGK